MATASASGLLSFVQINKRLSKLPKAPLSHVQYLLSHSIATRVYESTRRRRETHKRVGGDWGFERTAHTGPAPPPVAWLAAAKHRQRAHHGGTSTVRAQWATLNLRPFAA